MASDLLHHQPEAIIAPPREVQVRISSALTLSAVREYLYDMIGNVNPICYKAAKEEDDGYNALLNASVRGMFSKRTFSHFYFVPDASDKDDSEEDGSDPRLAIAYRARPGAIDSPMEVLVPFESLGVFGIGGPGDDNTLVLSMFTMKNLLEQEDLDVSYLEVEDHIKEDELLARYPTAVSLLLEDEMGKV